MFQGFQSHVPTGLRPTLGLPGVVDAHNATRGAVSMRGVVDGAPAQFDCLDLGRWSGAGPLGPLGFVIRKMTDNYTNQNRHSFDLMVVISSNLGT